MQETFSELTRNIKGWAKDLGFEQVGISQPNLESEQQFYIDWLNKNYHGDMLWLKSNFEKRLNPELLHPNTCRVISVSMNYLSPDTQQITILKSPQKAYISRYALGRDYHKLMRKRLAQLSQTIIDYCADNNIGPPDQRPFVDSAPILERPLARNAGIGWVGKHTLLIHPKHGSWFFLGELFTNLPLACDETIQPDKCGDCKACLQVCPTNAFPKPYVLDARRCISYLTIENKGPIPEEFREPIGNRIFGCDDCQAICPWNKYASFTAEDDFKPRHNLDAEDLVNLYHWDESEFENKTAGSAIRRTGYQGWLRNLLIALGNAPKDNDILLLLENRRFDKQSYLEEHRLWAINQQKTPNRRRKRKLKNNY